MVTVQQICILLERKRLVAQRWAMCCKTCWDVGNKQHDCPEGLQEYVWHTLEVILVRGLLANFAWATAI